MPDVEPSGHTINVGIIGPFSGPAHNLGQDGLEGIKTVLRLQPLLANGDAVKLVIADDRNDPELSVKALKKLIEQDKVSAVLFLSGSSAALAVNRIADRYQVPVLVLLATHPDIAKGVQFVSQLCFDNTFQGHVAALFARDELLINRAAVVFNPQSFYSRSLANEFAEKFVSIDGVITAKIPVNMDREDLVDTLSLLKDKGTQFLFLPVSPEIFIDLSKSLNTLRWKPERMGSDGLIPKIWRTYPKERELLDGVLDINMYSTNIKTTSFGKQATAIYQKLFDREGNNFNAAGAEGLAILFDAMNRCPAPADARCINRLIHHTDNFEGIQGRIAIHEDGKAHRPLIINRIKKGKTHFLVKVY